MYAGIATVGARAGVASWVRTYRCCNKRAMVWGHVWVLQKAGKGAGHVQVLQQVGKDNFRYNSFTI